MLTRCPKLVDFSYATLLETTRTLSVHDENGQQFSGVWSLWRQTPAEDAKPTQNLVFLANTTANPVAANVRVHCDAPRWEQWSLESGAAWHACLKYAWL